MAQLYYRYSSVSAGKSAEVIKIAQNYEKQNKRVIIFKSSTNDRYIKDSAYTQADLKRPAVAFSDTSSFLSLIQFAQEENKESIHCILVDDGHFMNRAQVLQLAQIVDYMDIPIIVYGLKNDYKNDLFDGSKALLIYADKIEEVKTVCMFCDKKATMVLRLKNNRPVYTQEQVVLTGKDMYIPVCRKCYGNPNISKLTGGNK